MVVAKRRTVEVTTPMQVRRMPTSKRHRHHRTRRPPQCPNNADVPILALVKSLADRQRRRQRRNVRFHHHNHRNNEARGSHGSNVRSPQHRRLPSRKSRQSCRNNARDLINGAAWNPMLKCHRRHRRQRRQDHRSHAARLSVGRCLLRPQLRRIASVPRLKTRAPRSQSRSAKSQRTRKKTVMTGRTMTTAAKRKTANTRSSATCALQSIANKFFGAAIGQRCAIPRAVAIQFF